MGERAKMEGRSSACELRRVAREHREGGRSERFGHEIETGMVCEKRKIEH